SGVIRDVRLQDLAQTRRAEHDHMIEALTADRANEPFGVRVLPGRTRRCQHFLDAHGLNRRSDGVEREIPIAEQITRRAIPGKRVAEVLRGPRRRRMSGDRGVHDAATVVRQNHKDKQQTARYRWYNKEIGSHQLRRMIGEEGAPRLGWWLSESDHVL